MGRSGNLSGASVALDLLPKDLCVTFPEESVISVQGPDQPAATAEMARAALARMQLDSATGSVALGPLAAFADLTAPFDTPCTAEGDVADLSAGRLAEALGRQLCAIIGQRQVNIQQVYRMALTLSGLNRSVEAHAMLSLSEQDDMLHPALLALRGYLSFQVAEAEVGRRALARAALSARGNPGMRGILHFTQHVLLVQQFGG